MISQSNEPRLARVVNTIKIGEEVADRAYLQRNAFQLQSAMVEIQDRQAN